MSTTEPEDGEEHSELILPFVAVVSRGGTFDDASYSAGFEVGHLWSYLEYQNPQQVDDTFRKENVEQLDLVAMHFGYVMQRDREYDCGDHMRLIFRKTQGMGEFHG